MFKELKEINSRPEPFQYYTAEELWTNEHTAKQMLEYHLNKDIDVSSRKHDFIDRSVDWIAEKFNIGENSSIADFGCGPGLYASRLAEKGAKVTAIDFSENSINYAREEAGKKGQEIDYVHANYLEFETDKKFDLIIMIFCDFCALSPEQRKTILNKFHSMLKPGGHVLLDVHTLNIFNGKQEAAIYELNQMNGFWSPDDYYCFVNSFRYDKEKVSLDKYTIIEENRTRVVYNWLQYFDRDSIRKEFEESGFAVESFYSDVAGKEFDPLSDDMAVVCKA